QDRSTWQYRGREVSRLRRPRRQSPREHCKCAAGVSRGEGRRHLRSGTTPQAVGGESGIDTEVVNTAAGVARSFDATRAGERFDSALATIHNEQLTDSSQGWLCPSPSSR